MVQISNGPRASAMSAKGEVQKKSGAQRRQEKKAAAKAQAETAELKAKVQELTKSLETESRARAAAQALCEKLFNEIPSGEDPWGK